MSRILSTAARQAMFAAETEQVFLLLLTIAHADLAETIRVAHNSQDVVSRGETYLAYPFRIELPADRDDQVAQVQLSIDNVDRQIVQAVRSLSGSPSVTLEVVLASSPDLLEAGPFEFSLLDAGYDALTVTGTLGYEDVLNEPYPGDSFTPNLFPGMF
jgi:hypothetical protein